MQAWGFLIPALACDACGKPYRVANGRGKYLWEVGRAANLCVCWGQEWSLATGRNPAYGVTQDHISFFLDFVAMWTAGCARGTVWAGLEHLGVGMARGQAERLHIRKIPIIQNRTLKAPLDMMAAAGPHPECAPRTLTQLNGRLQLQMAIAYRRMHIRPTRLQNRQARNPPEL